METLLFLLGLLNSPAWNLLISSNRVPLEGIFIVKKWRWSISAPKIYDNLLPFLVFVQCNKLVWWAEFYGDFLMNRIHPSHQAKSEPFFSF